MRLHHFYGSWTQSSRHAALAADECRSQRRQHIDARNRRPNQHFAPTATGSLERFRRELIAARIKHRLAFCRAIRHYASGGSTKIRASRQSRHGLSRKCRPPIVCSDAPTAYFIPPSTLAFLVLLRIADGCAAARAAAGAVATTTLAGWRFRYHPLADKRLGRG